MSFLKITSSLTVRVLVNLTLLAGLATGKSCHGSHCPVPGPGEVESAIDQLHMHYNDKLCLEVLLLDCTKHVSTGDERVCGNNGHEYPDHCHFAHSRCEFLHSDEHKLEVAYLGPCPESTTTTTTVTPTTTTSSMPIEPIVTTDHTLVPLETARPITTTVDPIYGIMQNVFCQNANNLVCNQEFDLKCGSNGLWFKNTCEFSKAKCTDNDLYMVDLSFCTDPSAQ